MGSTYVITSSSGGGQDFLEEIHLKLSPLGEVRVIQMKQRNRGPDFTTENSMLNELMWFNIAKQRTQRGAGAMREKARKGNRSTHKEACRPHASART